MFLPTRLRPRLLLVVTEHTTDGVVSDNDKGVRYISLEESHFPFPVKSDPPYDENDPQPPGEGVHFFWVVLNSRITGVEILYYLCTLIVDRNFYRNGNVNFRGPIGDKSNNKKCT